MPAGFTAVMAYNDGTWDVPDFKPIENVRDVTVANTYTDIDASSRKGLGFAEHEQGLRDGTVDFAMVWVPGPVGTDVGFDRILAAFNTRANIELWIADGALALAGTQGLHAEFRVLDFTQPQPLDDLMVADVSVAPGWQAATGANYNAPEWLVNP